MAYASTMQSTGRFTSQLKKLAHYAHDHCQSCRQKLTWGEPAFAGYDVDGQPIYVGRCCQETVSELASHVYWWWRNFQRPSPETTIWRYVDFSKFVQILNSRSIYFSRSDELGDRFEGARGVKSRMSEWRNYCLQYYESAILNPPSGTVAPSAEQAREQAERLYEQSESAARDEVLRTFVNCWHGSEGESEALWRLYTPPGTCGIALKTKFGLLDAALDQNLEAVGGYVQYIDFQKSFAGTYDRIFWKRSSLMHEAEIRLVLIQPPSQVPPPPGILVPVNLSAAIEAVTISPFAPPWSKTLVADTLAHYGIVIPVLDSAIREEPFY